MIKLLNDEQLLDPKFRKVVLDEIKASANTARKVEALKRSEVDQDNTVKYVMLKLQREGLKPETLALMENRASNISICKKIINKLARVYSGAVNRSTNGTQTNDEQIAELAKLMNFNRGQKNADRTVRLQKNALAWVYPEHVADQKYKICTKIYDPSQFDVIPKAGDAQQAGCVILSDLSDPQAGSPNLGSGPQVTHLEGQHIAGQGEKAQTFIWWSDKYHFTTDDKGEIIGVGSVTPEDLLNPIGILPGVTCAENQNGKYWATGGQDIVDGSILVNTMLTDMNAITYMQGWGQLVITGEHIPDDFTIGPFHALCLRYSGKKDEPKPEVTVVNANPPLEAWMQEISQYVALLLSTNNLSVSSVAVKLDQSNFPSGIALLVDKSELTESVEDNQQDFYWYELKEWELVKRWHNLFYDRKALVKEFSDVGRLPDDLIVTPKFAPKTGEVLSTAERLANMKVKKELGLVSQLDLILEENPGMTKEDAQKKLDEINAAKPEVEDESTEPPNPSDE